MCVALMVHVAVPSLQTLVSWTFPPHGSRSQPVLGWFLQRLIDLKENNICDQLWDVGVIDRGLFRGSVVKCNDMARMLLIQIIS